MTRLLTAAAATAVLAGPALAAPDTLGAECRERIQQIDSLIPKEERQQAARRMNVDPNHLKAAEAALDAARLAGEADEWTQCRELAEAANGLLNAGGWSPRTK